MRISINEVKDYMKCPLYYKFKHSDCIYDDLTIGQLFKIHLKSAIGYYYFSIIDDLPKHYKSMLKKWEMLWYSSDMLKKFDSAELDEYSNKAIPMINNFYTKSNEEKGAPVAVNFTYEVTLAGEDNIDLTGEIDLIRILNDRTRSRETQLVKFFTSNSRLDEFLMRSNIDMTMASYAFRDSFKKTENVILCRNVYRKEDFRTSRNGADYTRAIKSIRNICRGIKERVFYPINNKISCSTCRYKVFCMNERAIN